MSQGIIGKKLGMTQIFSDDGKAEAVTAIEAGPCTVTQIKTAAKEGYDAAQLGFDEKKRLKQSQKEKAKGFKHLREFREDDIEAIKMGDRVDVSLFKAGDGIIKDEEDCMKYCMKVEKELAAGKRKDLKLVLIGVGEEVDEGQLERFDDMFEGTDLEDDVDIWSHGIAAHMRDESDIIGVLFGELMTEELIVAPSGSIIDANDNEVMSFPDGLPGKFRFVLPKGCASFTVHTPSADVTQDISEVLETT